MLVVNVASKWGLTDSNYKQLVQIYTDLNSKGLQILAFPCNQFGKQEPGTPDEIKAFVAKYGVEFPLLEKVDVNGPNTHAAYSFMKKEDITWNFAKFLVNSAGQVHKAYGPKEDPNSILPDIMALLKWLRWVNYFNRNEKAIHLHRIQFP